MTTRILPFSPTDFAKEPTFYGQNADLRTRLELSEVLRMPGQTPTSKPVREALLRLHLHQWLPQKEPILKVLFVGSSHTLIGKLRRKCLILNASRV